MLTMPKCSFSGEDIPEGTGIMYVLKEGKVLFFKNSKCKKNYLKLKRIPRKVRWTEFFRKENRKGEAGEKKEAAVPKVKKAAAKEEKPAAKKAVEKSEAGEEQ